jgi:hypothetical protein
MDFTNYTTLQAAVADFLSRDDLSTQIPGFITLAEAQIRRRLRRTATAGTVTFTGGQSSVALAADVDQVRTLAPPVSASLARGGPPLKQVPFDTLAELRSALPNAGRPRYFAVLAGTLYVAPAPADQFTTLTISYYEKLVPLGAANPTNVVLIEAPDAYLYGACLEAAPYLEHDERIPVWQARFDMAIEELNEKRQREEFGASLQTARLPMVFG